MSNSTWSMSDIDGFLQMFHAGELTDVEAAMLRQVLRRVDALDLLDRASYDAAVA